MNDALDREPTRTPCQLLDPDMWFSPDPDRQARAVAMCQVCPVQVPCLREAITEERGLSEAGRYGVWGGKTPTERAGMRHMPTRRDT